MIKLQNQFITACINEAGAELKSLVYNGTEYIWEGRPEVWNSSCPLLFPICGGLKDDKYLYNGKEYTLQKHGFVRAAEFEVERADDTYAIFCIKSTSETKKCYPFDYELRVATFYDPEGAQRLGERLRKAGMRTRLTKSARGDRKLHYVAVLMRGTVEEYQALRGRLAGMGLRDSMVISKVAVVEKPSKAAKKR